MKQFDYFDHEADIGIIGRGASLEAAFINAAKAVFAIMTDIEKLNPKTSFAIEFIESDCEFALITWLNLLIGEAKSQGLVCCQFSLTHNDDKWQGQAWGQPWNETIEHGVEVKGATLTMLKVATINSLWEARCVVDV